MVWSEGGFQAGARVSDRIIESRLFGSQLWENLFEVHVAHKSHHFLRLNVSLKFDLKWLDFFCLHSMVCHLGGYWSSRAGTSALPLP